MSGAKSSTGVEAGRAFEKAASIQGGQLKEPDDEANTLTEAFSMFSQITPLSPGI
jgi:alpha-soluble NSF attachment protein